MTGSKFLEEGGLDKKNIINNFFFLWGRWGLGPLGPSLCKFARICINHVKSKYPSYYMIHISNTCNNLLELYAISHSDF